MPDETENLTSKYPDLEPDGLGDLKSITRISGMKTSAPHIEWGGEYLGWDIKKRLSFAERLASSMNHAADILQIERNKLLEVCTAQEELIKDHVRKYVSQGELMHKELQGANAEQQKLYTTIVDIQKELKKSKQQARVLAKELEKALADD